MKVDPAEIEARPRIGDRLPRPAAESPAAVVPQSGGRTVLGWNFEIPRPAAENSRCPPSAPTAPVRRTPRGGSGGPLRGRGPGGERRGRRPLRLSDSGTGPRSGGLGAVIICARGHPHRPVAGPPQRRSDLLDQRPGPGPARLRRARRERQPRRPARRPGHAGGHADRGGGLPRRSRGPRRGLRADRRGRAVPPGRHRRRVRRLQAGGHGGRGRHTGRNRGAAQRDDELHRAGAGDVHLQLLLEPVPDHRGPQPALRGHVPDVRGGRHLRRRGLRGRTRRPARAPGARARDPQLPVPQPDRLHPRRGRVASRGRGPRPGGGAGAGGPAGGPRLRVLRVPGPTPLGPGGGADRRPR